MSSEGMTALGKILVSAGVIITVVGAVVMMSDRIPWLGRLPGDITIVKENLRVYAPITTSVLVSIIASLVLWAISQMRK